MITIKEIADQLGVSATTVSNVLNGRAGKMSQETRQRVEEALLRNHYVKEKKNNRGEPQHHLVAVYICLGKKKHVLTDPFCGSLLEGIDRELRKYNRAMVCGTVDDNESFAKVLQNSNLEGAILLGCEAEFCTALVHQIPIPIVFVDSYVEGVDNIGLEDYEGGYEMTSYLIGQGHRKIAFFGDQQHPMGSSLYRFRGLQKAMEEHKLEFDKDDYFYLPHHDNYRHEVLRQFAQNVKKTGYTAAFFISDFLANEAISIFYSKGISVPEDLSVTGFDDNIYARLSRPMLTTMRQKPEEKGKEAVGLLMRRIYGEEVPDRVRKMKKSEFLQGIRHGIPICLGYFSVSAAFGITAVRSGLPLWTAVLISLTNVTSAGQFAGVNLMVAGGSMIEIAMTTLIINIRYFLMSLSVSQKVESKMSMKKRLGIAYGITDEIFAVSMQQPRKLTASYMAGLILTPVVGWTLGTFVGGAATQLMPQKLSSAMGIALYGMFIAIIIPPAREQKSVLFTVILAIAASVAFSSLPVLKHLSGGWAIILITILVSGIAAWLFPRNEEENAG